MKTKEITFKHRGKQHSITVALPDTISEIAIFPENEILEYLHQALILRAKDEYLRSKRKKWLRLKLESLTKEQLSALRMASLL